MENDKEQLIIELLRKQREAVMPSRALCARILANIPNPVRRISAIPWYARILVPAGVAVAVLLLAVFMPRRGIPAEARAAFDVSAIQNEQTNIAAAGASINQYFDQEAAMQEIDAALAEF